MITNINPRLDDFNETTNALKFAALTKTVSTVARTPRHKRRRHQNLDGMEEAFITLGGI